MERKVPGFANVLELGLRQVSTRLASICCEIADLSIPLIGRFDSTPALGLGGEQLLSGLRVLEATPFSGGGRVLCASWLFLAFVSCRSRRVEKVKVSLAKPHDAF